MLTGEGADELFAGYEYLREFIGGRRASSEELVRTVEALHNLNLQRCRPRDDGPRARGPGAVPRSPGHRATSVGPPRGRGSSLRPGEPEKRLLREAFDGWLPEDLLWRGKEQFGDGSGASEVLTEVFESGIGEEELEAEKDRLDPPVRTREELAYLRIFQEALPGVQIEQTLTRFATA